ncbi:UDP-N-acetylglucosamine--N-acetylmuramyl-(pentapeptide) pyrophosphoryl-undecaprenol N-acetylglucosamine transferase [hydrothermal vent metagenome]|uniref:UDP-N-acetylglucosamine--N-acetylmuramyl-(Pentapeptide) pyrophosphoryl-undecaprenol N-acetylglucosamine transferase n=1 Tax=hydrothermal vent metagenome TaxID=652676 RepID=A0A3B0ZEH8_9ZZZZ
MMHVLIATGGTGGHVYPALAVAEELISRGVKVSWMGTRKGMECKIVSAKSIPLYFISVTGLRGKGLLGWLLAPFKLSVAIGQALSICIKHKPNVVLGMGGFVSGPGGIASWILRKPLVIHEQNTIAGMTNKMLANFATHVVQAFPETFKSSVQAIHIGNPVRREIETIVPPAERFAEHTDKKIHVLVLGGSLGALALNKALPATFNAIEKTCALSVVHQTGLRHLQNTKDIYSQTLVDVTVVDYIDDMPARYNWADVVICRSGALTVSELCAAGVGSLLIPYPHAVDDHQYYNAKYLADGGAAIIVRQSEIKSTDFIQTLESLLCKGRSKLLQMAENARLLAMHDAANKVADLCCNLMAKPEKRALHG